MAYKVSYKVVSEQGEALKKTAKDMDNYINQLDQIISKLGNDELFQSVREQLKKFRQQLEEERTVLNLAGQVIVEVVQSYTGAEKKSVSKVDKAKAHNRDFYKRPVVVASAGGASAGASAMASGGTVNVAASASSVTNTTVIHNTTNVINSSPAPSTSTTTSTPVTPVASTVTGATAAAGMGEGMAAAAGALGAAATAAVAAGAAAVMKKKTESEVGTADVNVDGDVIDGTYVEV